MKKRYISLIFASMILLSTLLLFGCKQDTIKFYRESAVTSTVNKLLPQKQKANSNKGVIILHDNDKKSEINFGPKDINFDMPSRF